MGVKTAFLNEDVKGREHVRMSRPIAAAKLGVITPGEERLAQKARYGLKKAPKAWEDELKVFQLPPARDWG